MFSVIIPLFNKERSVRNTLQSVLDQTYRDFEVIIINDGSTDKSLEIVKAFNDERIRVINQKNSGVSSARNKGIKEAKYEWISFLDADDTWEKEKLEYINNVILNSHEIKWIVHAYTTKIGNREKHNTYKRNGILENVIMDLKDGLKIQTSTVTVKKEVFIKDSRLYFREGINNSEDREVWYKLSCLYPKSFYINLNLSNYVIDKTSMSLTKIQSTENKIFHFLNMKKRLENVMNDINVENANILIQIINEFNKKSILGYWVTLHKMPNIFMQHISLGMFLFLKFTVKFPRIIKRIIFRIWRRCDY